MNIRSLIPAVLLLLACLAAAPAWAQWPGSEQWLAERGGADRFLVPRGGPDRPERSAPGATALGPDRAAAAARDATGGKVLGVYPGGEVYHVKLLYRDGRVRMVRVDARTGAVLD